VGSVSEAQPHFETLKWLPKQNELRNFLITRECAEVAQALASLA
jgi:hypothetical protein